MHADAQYLTNPLKKQAKYIGIQATDDHLDALHEVAVTDKKSLCEFHPMAQSTYSALQQLDSIVYVEWVALEKTQPSKLDSEKAQTFITSASILLGDLKS